MPVRGRENRWIWGGCKHSICGQEEDRENESVESGSDSERGRGTNRDLIPRVLQTRRFQFHTGKYWERLLAHQKATAQYFAHG